MNKKIKISRFKQRKKVLVVDDERLARDVTSMVLNRYLGCDVYTASNGDEALDLLDSHTFDLLIADLAMPGISGVELIKTVREIKPDTWIMVVTGNADESDIRELNDAGIEQVIYKPFKISDLLEKVKDILTEKEQVTNFA